MLHSQKCRRKAAIIFRQALENYEELIIICYLQFKGKLFAIHYSKIFFSTVLNTRRSALTLNIINLV